MKRLALLASLPFTLAFGAPVALAQDAGEKLTMVDVYGEDACPQSRADEIVVCRRMNEGDRYRIPESLRGNPDNPRNEPWADRVTAYETVGAQGISSCSPVGAGGATGCMAKMIDAAYKERREGGDKRYGQMIEAERAKRLSTIDAEAADTQARVEQLEKEYDAKVARERAAEEARETVPPLPAPPGK